MPAHYCDDLVLGGQHSGDDDAHDVPSEQFLAPGGSLAAFRPPAFDRSAGRCHGGSPLPGAVELSAAERAVCT
jgi:hypothetical protein